MFTPSEDELHRRSRRSTLLSQHELTFSIAFYATGGPIQWVNGCFRAWRVEQAKSPGAPWSGRSIVVVWLNPFGGPSAAECRRGGVPWGWANRRGNDWVGMFEAQGEDAVVTGEVGASRTGSVPPIRSYSGSRPVSSRAESPDTAHRRAASPALQPLLSHTARLNRMSSVLLHVHATAVLRHAIGIAALPSGRAMIMDILDPVCQGTRER